LEEGLLISSNPESKVGGNIATSRVFQAEEIKRVRTRGRELFRRRHSDTSSPDIGKSDISKLKHCAINCKANSWVPIDVSRVRRTAPVLRRGEKMEETLHYSYLSCRVTFYNQGKTTGYFL
jgi:hypothetical protein